ncbi:chaplin [Streptomyces sp. NPDC058665]|uniref:chaplin n=1 Tax=Streptomyces sp. NPDC058665 TaxID=3346586 RepID=UPI0036563B0E
MRQVTRKGLISVAAAGGVLAIGGYAQADSSADGTAANSPGVLSGNNVQVPVHIPVNACGNTVNAVGALNPATGNACANKSDGGRGQGGGSHGSEGRTDGKGGSHGGSGGGGSHADGGTANSPGVGSGNTIQVPLDIPLNVCGNTVDIVGVLNPAVGNECANADTPAPPAKETPETPGTPEPPTDRTLPPSPNEPKEQTVEPAAEGTDVLATTGGDGLGLIIPAGAALLLAGTVIYRRARSAA